MNIIYLRVSTNETEQDLKSQLNAIISKYNLTKYVVFKDEGSAYNQAKIGKRTDFIRLLETLFNSENITIKDLFLQTFETRTYEINLYVWDYSRIMRNIEMNLLFYLLTSKFHVNIISWKDNVMIDTSNQEITTSNRLMSILNYLLLSYSAEMYSSDISKNVSKSVDNGYSIYGMKWGTYQANENWMDYWSKEVVNNKGQVFDRVTKNNHLRVTKEEDMKFKTYIKRLLGYGNMRKEVIEIVKERKGIVLTHKFLSTLVNSG